MKLGIKLKDFKKITGAELLKGSFETKLFSFSTDTRKLKKGDVFWALKGEKFDANLFVKEALNKGIKGVICQKGFFPKELLHKVAFAIEVKDTLKALQDLAEYVISQKNIPVISVTGSNGKTTTKEMLKHILSKKAPVCSNFGNFNNHFGLPFSVLELREKHKYAVFELGASKRGDVKELAEIISPDISIITTIGPEHLKFFKNMSNIFKTETETLPFLKKNGLALYNGDNVWLKKIKNKKIKKFSFGFEKQNDLVVKLEKNKIFFLFKKNRYEIKLKNKSEHNILNAAAAFLAALFLKIPPETAIKSLSSFKGVKMRMQEFKINKNNVIFDAYNANPQSMEALLKDCADKNPKILILGDMKELGKYSLKYHKELGSLLKNVNFEKLYLIGEEIKPAYSVLKKGKENVKYLLNADFAEKEIKTLFLKKTGYYFVFKASRSMKFEKLLPEEGLKKVILKH